MIYTFIDRVCPDLPTAACCRVMKVSTSGFYAWRTQPCSDRDLDDAYLTNTMVDIHRMSRRSYGSPKVHAELRLGLDTKPVSRASTGADGPVAPDATPTLSRRPIWWAGPSTRPSRTGSGSWT